MSKKLFPEIIGQDAAKRKLAFFINGYKASKIIPHIMFVAPKGCGKTTLAKAKEIRTFNNIGEYLYYLVCFY